MRVDGSRESTFLGTILWQTATRSNLGYRLLAQDYKTHQKQVRRLEGNRHNWMKGLYEGQKEVSNSFNNQMKKVSTKIDERC